MLPACVLCHHLQLPVDKMCYTNKRALPKNIKLIFVHSELRITLPFTHSRTHIMQWPVVALHIPSRCGTWRREIYDSCLHNQLWIQKSVEHLTKRHSCKCEAWRAEELYISAHRNDKYTKHAELLIMHPIFR